jgi:hypothetical protein
VTFVIPLWRSCLEFGQLLEFIVYVSCQVWGAFIIILFSAMSPLSSFWDSSDIKTRFCYSTTYSWEH